MQIALPLTFGAILLTSVGLLVAPAVSLDSSSTPPMQSSVRATVIQVHHSGAADKKQYSDTYCYSFTLECPCSGAGPDCAILTLDGCLEKEATPHEMARALAAEIAAEIEAAGGYCDADETDVHFTDEVPNTTILIGGGNYNFSSECGPSC